MSPEPDNQRTCNPVPLMQERVDQLLTEMKARDIPVTCGITLINISPILTLSPIPALS